MDKNDLELIFIPHHDQDVADFLDVSRQAVYLWFLGKSLPHPTMRETLKDVIKKLKARQPL
jgi:hypothetical protein